MNVRLNLLGEIRVHVGEERIVPPADKRLGLLGYLACAGAWVERDHLAWLFWPDVPSSRARTNLRGLLTRAKGEPYAQGLETEPDRLRWLVPHDVAAFQEAVAREDWDAALRVHRGPFMGASAWDGVGELSGWIETQRERLSGEYRRAVLARASAAPAGDTVSIEALDVLLAEDPFDEEVARRAIAARVAAGRRDDAQRLADAWRKRFGDELGGAPSEATERLIAGLARSATIGPAQDATDASTSLTPFVGRRAELRELAQRLERKDCRLLTLTGPGGVGKSRLALQVASETSRRYRDGMRSIDLATARTAQDVAVRIAHGLDVRLAREEGAEHTVQAALADAELLLVLDDMDGALPAAPWLIELLRACPGTTLLVTSRQRLDLPGEWVVRLGGLERPAPDAGLEEAREADAVRLFADAAARVEPRFALDGEALPSVLRICSTVGGLPLALELAAAWVRALPVAELADELEAGIELLMRTPRGDDDRHRSVRAAFEHSWERLEAIEADVYASLSVFRGPFRRDAAAAVADATIPTLAALVDRSLLRLTADGRYARHPLLSSFAREKLAGRPDLERRSRERHATWFARWIEAAAERYERGSSSVIAREAIAAHDDLIAALEEAIESGNAEQAARCASSLAWYWLWRGRWRAGRAWIDRVRGLTFPAGSPHEAEMLRLAALLGAPGGDYAGARALVEEALRRARAIGAVACQVRCLNELGFYAAHTGDAATAWAYLDEGLALSTEEEQPTGRMALLANGGALAVRSGETERARDLLDRALALAERHGNVKIMGIAHLHRGRLDRQLGDARSARAELEQALAHLDASDHVDFSTRARLHLAFSSLAEGDLEAAASLLDVCLARWWEAGLMARLPDALHVAAAVSARRGAFADAARLRCAAAAVAPDAASLLFPSELAFLDAFFEGAASHANDEARGTSPVLVADAVALARELLGRGSRHPGAAAP